MALRSGVDPAEAKENPEASALRAAATHAPDHTLAMLRSGVWNGDTATQWFARWARETPSQHAFVDERRATTYAEAFGQAEAFAAALLGLGLRKGDVVAIQLPNRVEFAIAYLGITMMGGVLTTLHMPYRQSEAEPILRHAGARAVICGPRAETYAPAEMFLGMRQRLPLLRHVIVVGEMHPGTEEFGDLIARGAGAAIDNPPQATDPAFICFSSGTSASPKSVVHSYQNMLANNRQCAPLYGLTQNDVIVSGPPFTHGFGICCINLTILVGATHALFPPFKPDTYCQAIERLRPTVLFTAPAHIAACWKSGLLERTDFSSLRIVGISGAPCPPPVAAALQRVATNSKVFVLWGMTELFMGISGRPEDAEEDRFSTIGRPTPGMEVRIAAEDGQPLPPGEEGEIVIRGPSVVAGYLGNEAATNAAFRGGWFRTGDVGVIDRRGFVRMTRRLGEVINRGGVKINPVDIEALLDNHPKVQQSAIVPFADAILGQRACAFVVLRPNQSLTLDEVTRYLESQGVAKLKWPERLELLAEMPMTPTRKIIKGLLKPSATVS